MHSHSASVMNDSTEFKPYATNGLEIVGISRTGQMTCFGRDFFQVSQRPHSQWNSGMFFPNLEKKFPVTAENNFQQFHIDVL